MDALAHPWPEACKYMFLKAFDSVAHQFIFDTLKKFDFGIIFLQQLKLSIKMATVLLSY